MQKNVLEWEAHEENLPCVMMGYAKCWRDDGAGISDDSRRGSCNREWCQMSRRKGGDGRGESQGHGGF